MAINDRLFSISRPKNQKKDKKITILEEVTIRTSTGDLRTVLKPVFTDIRAYVRHISTLDVIGGEEFPFDNYEDIVLFGINYRTGIKKGMKILYKGLVYNINKVDMFEDYKNDIMLTGAIITPPAV